jgi:transcriptional regulator with XRE-family HTH domain
VDNTQILLPERVSMDARLFGPRLRDLREGRGLTQGELAKAIGVRQTAVSGWELGEREPDLATLVKLAEFFGVTVNDFLEPAKGRRRRRPGRTGE